MKNNRVESQPTLLKDLALAAGLSVSGVSRALRGDTRMSKVSREKVRKLADRMGYRPVAAARALRGRAGGYREAGFQGTVGYLVYSYEMGMIRAPGARERFPWVFAAQERAKDLGYAVDHFLLEEDRRSSRALGRILKARGIRGLILSAKHDDLSTLEFDWDSHCAISLSASPSIQFLTNLSIPFFQDTYTAVIELWRRGYRRVGFVMIGNILDQFLAGYQSAVHRTGLPVVAPLVSERGVPQRLDDWIRRHRLDAILTTTGLELLDAVQSTGRDVPGDIGMCFVDDIDAPGRLSGLHQPREKLASLAMDMLHLMIQHHEQGIPADPLDVHLPSSWSEGETLLPAAPGGADAPKRRGRRQEELDHFVRRYHPVPARHGPVEPQA